MLDINDFQKTDLPNPECGFHIKGIYLLNNEKYILKTLSTHVHYKDEVYLLYIIEVILGEKNSTQCFLVEDKENKKYYIASKFIEKTTNLYAELEKYKEQKTISNVPKNFVSSMMLSIILNNININSGNVLIDQDNRFYIIDPLVLSQYNAFNIDMSSLKRKINQFYNEFILETNRNLDNIKENLKIFFIECYRIYNIYYYKPLLEFLKSNNKDTGNPESSDYLSKNNSQEKINHLTKLIEHNDILINGYIANLIDLMTLNQITQEISMIKLISDQKRKDLNGVVEYFESKQNFPHPDNKLNKHPGIQNGYGDEVFAKIEKLKDLQLSSMDLGVIGVTSLKFHFA